MLKSASPDDLKPENIRDRLQKLVAVGNGNGKQTNGFIQQVMQSGVGSVASAVLDKIDFSNVDVDKVTHQLQEIKGKVQDIDVESITQELKKLRDKATETVAANIPK